VNIKDYVTSPKKLNYWILFLLQLSNFFYLRKIAICCRDIAILLISLYRNSFVPKRDITPKFPFQKLRSARMFALYRMTSGDDG